MRRVCLSPCDGEQNLRWGFSQYNCLPARVKVSVRHIVVQTPDLGVPVKPTYH